MKKTIISAVIVVVLALAGGLKASAQHAYAYGGALDLQAGLSSSFYSVDGSAAKAHGLAGGGEFNIRYTYYFNRHWGIWGGFSLDRTNAAEPSFFRVVNRADGNAYSYRMDNWCCSRESAGASYFGAAAGAAYRFDFGRWSLRPRLGLALASAEQNTYSYVRYDRADDTKAPTFYSFRESTEKLDYMYDDSFTYGGSPVTVAALASLQLTCTLGRHFYFSIEAGAKTMPYICKYENTVSQGKSCYNPETWVEAVYDSSLQGQWCADPATAVTTQQPVTFGAIFNFNVGIGWNIGWNRYESGKHMN